MATETPSASTCVDGSGGAIGMPQLCGDWYANQIFWLVITLVVIYILMSRIALPRIAEVLRARATAIQSDLDKAEELKARAVDAEAAYKAALVDARAQAQAIVADARAEIQKELDAATAKADAEIAAKAAEAEARIADIRASSEASVREVAGSIAGDIVEAVAPGKADAKALDAAIAARLGE